MFQFRRFPSYTYWFSIWYPKVGFPIRKSTDQGSFAAPRSLSQLITSFIGSWCQGIPLALLLAWSLKLSLQILLLRKSNNWFSVISVRIMQAQFQKFLKQNCIYYPFNLKVFLYCCLLIIAFIITMFSFQGAVLNLQETQWNLTSVGLQSISLRCGGD